MQTQPSSVKLRPREDRRDFAWLTMLSRLILIRHEQPRLWMKEQLQALKWLVCAQQVIKITLLRKKRWFLLYFYYFWHASAAEAGGSGLLCLWARSLLSLSAWEQSQLLPLSLEDFLSNSKLPFFGDRCSPPRSPPHRSAARCEASRWSVGGWLSDLVPLPFSACTREQLSRGQLIPP